jgi:hypothetical protein
MSALYSSTIATCPAHLATQEYSGKWYYNGTGTATSLSNQNATRPTTSSNQWTLISSYKNMNSASMMNSSGYLIAPVDGMYHVNFSCFFNTSSTTGTLTDLEIWFTYQGINGTFAPRVAWHKNGAVQPANQVIAISTSDFVSLYKGDVLIPEIYQINSNSAAIQLPTVSGNVNGSSGSSGDYTSQATVLSMNLIFPTK